jgi:hypothetical protein
MSHQLTDPDLFASDLADLDPASVVLGRGLPPGWSMHQTGDGRWQCDGPGVDFVLEHERAVAVAEAWRLHEAGNEGKST